MAFKTTVVLLAFMASARLVHSTFFDTSNTNYEISSKLRNATDIQFPLQSGEVNGRMVIVDSSGQRVKLACVNWSGAQLEGYVVNGLDKQPLASIAQRIASLGFNCVRLVYSLDVVYKNTIIDEERLTANPELIGKTAMEIFDLTVQALTDESLMVILNNHNSNAGWCCSYEDMNGMWYTPEYPEEKFFEHWTLLAKRYLSNPFVIGADLRNEIRGVLDESVTLGTLYATWGLGVDSTDWNLAAEKAAIRVHEANPNMLIIVGGIFTGGFLSPAFYAPVIVPNQAKLVYQGHIYGGVPVLSDLPYDTFDSVLTSLQRFVEVAGHEYSAPFWMGEFGTGSDNENWRKILRFIGEHDLDWGVWCLDGYQYGRGDETYGILDMDFATVRHPWKLEQLQEIMMSTTNLS